MSTELPSLHLVCGKIASGKSTLAAALGQSPGTVVIAEDDWLPALYRGEMSTISDYVRCAGRLQEVLGPHVAAILRAGASVVLDFPANTIASRAWMRQVIRTAGVPHKLHCLDVPDEICMARLRARNAAGTHPFAVTEAQFRQITRHFVAPTAEEGFDIVLHPPDTLP